MNVAVGVLTHNRPELLRRTLASIRDSDYPFTLDVIDNGSTDETAEIVRGLGGHRNDGPDISIAAGFNMVAELALSHDPDLVVFSADDFEYPPGWLRQVVDFWEYAPPSLCLLGTYMEPRWRWNAPYGAIEAGPRFKRQRALLRFAISHSNWTFKASDWPIIGPIRDIGMGSGDKDACKRIQQEHRLLVASLDLVTHLGADCSQVNPHAWEHANDITPELKLWGMA